MPDPRKLRAVLANLNAEARRPTSRADVAPFVTGAFDAFEGDAGLLDLCALVSLHSRRDERQWISLRNVPSPRDLEILLDAAARHAGAEPVYVEQLGIWVIIHAIGPSVFTALFDDRAAAAAGLEDVAMLAEVLRLGLATQRRINDGHLMGRLAFAPSQKGWPRGELQKAMESIAEHMRSDGAKIYLCRRTEVGPCLEIFSRTDLDPEQSREPYRISRTHGLADWVLLHGDYILIEDSVAPERMMEEPERCRTGRHGPVSVLGRPGRDQDPNDPTGDRERAFLLVPMREQDRVVGVLSFWRLSDDTYDPDLDLASAEHLAARLAPICQSILATEVRDAVANELARLGAMVAKAQNPRDIYAAVVASAGTLARGALALLFLADDRGILYEIAEWVGRHPVGAQRTTVFYSIHSNPTSWVDGAPETVKARIHERHPGYRVRTHAVLPAAGSSAGSGRAGVAGVVFVLDRVDEEPPATCDDGLAEHEASSFLRQVAPIVFGSYAKVFAASIGRRLREASPAGDRLSSEWASNIAQTIREAVAADAVLIYQRERGDLRITGASLGHHGAVGLTVVHDSLTRRCLLDGRPRLIPDIADPSHPDVAQLHRETLNKLTSPLGWSGVRSWYCQPVVAEAQSLGAIKLLTRNGGAFLDPSCAEVVAAIAAHIASEMARHFRTDVLDDLNRLSENLSGKEGGDLADAMVRELEGWAGRFVHENCRVVVMASLHTPQVSVFAASEPIEAEAFEQANSQQLAVLAGPATGELFRRASPFSLPDDFNRAHQLPVAISLNSNPQLRGCLLLITEDVVGKQARSAARKAAREIAILLDYEQRARLRTEQAARFRHALIGPVQGLMNQAGELNRLIRRGNATADELKNISARIKSETNAVGLWRDLQRLYSTNEVKVVLRTRALRPIIEGCVERFREPIRVERGGTLHLDFRPQGQVDIPIDGPAIDLALNNLLDNARKYCFAHTTVTVIVDIDKPGAWVRVTIEDIGHGIPKRLQERIYQIGERLDWEDRVRSIDGTGLGLPISREIVVKHGGRLCHECDEGISVSDPNRCRVRFIMELPTGWR